MPLAVAAARVWNIVTIAADIQETTQDRTVCSQLSRLLAAATSDTCFFFFFRIARTSLSRYSFCKVSSLRLIIIVIIIVLYCVDRISERLSAERLQLLQNRKKHFENQRDKIKQQVIT